GSFGAFRTDAPLLKPVGLQTTAPVAQKPLNPAPAPQSSTAQTPPTPPPLTPVPTSSMPLVLGGPVINQSAAPTIFGDDCNACGTAGRNFGVSADQCGWIDNISARIGGTVSAINDYSVLGGAVM